MHTPGRNSLRSASFFSAVLALAFLAISEPHPQVVPPGPVLSPDAGGLGRPWTGELPDGVPEQASPYDEESAPPPLPEALPVMVNPVQELVQRLSSARLVPPAVEAATARPAGAITTEQMIANARALLGVRYLWGGNSTGGMDCSAYVSRVWGVSRQSTDTLHTVGYAITKEELRAGDVLNLTRRQDPRGYGHVRVFERWANAARTRMWVYEETPPRAIYHVIAYDPRYTPMRRADYYPEETAELTVAMEELEQGRQDQPLALVHRSLVAPAPAPRAAATPPPVTRRPAAREPAEAEGPEKHTTAPLEQRGPGRSDRAASPTKTPTPARAVRTATPASSPLARARHVVSPTAVPIPATPEPTQAPVTPTPRPAPTFTPTPAGPPPSPPVRVTGLPQGCREALISWDYTDRTAAGVRIYRDGRFLGGVSRESRYYVDSSLQLDTTYRYTVTTWNAAGESSGPPVAVRTRPESERCK